MPGPLQGATAAAMAAAARREQLRTYLRFVEHAKAGRNKQALAAATEGGARFFVSRRVSPSLLRLFFFISHCFLSRVSSSFFPRLFISLFLSHVVAQPTDPTPPSR